MISPDTNGYDQPMQPDALLIKKTNHILKRLEKHELHYELLFIESQLIVAKAAFLNACIKEANDNRYDSEEKIIARNLLESTIELFEKTYKKTSKK